MKKVLMTIFAASIFGVSYGQYELDWNVKIGGAVHDDCRGIVESNNFIYTVGRIEDDCVFNDGSTFSTETSVGADDIFVAKSDMDGNYIWVKTMGGTLSEQAVNVAIGPNGDIYVTGFFGSTFDFEVGTPTSNISAIGGKDIFIARMDTDGDLVWVKQVSGSLDEQAEGITVQSDGVVLSGRFKGTVDFDPSVATSNLTSNGNNDIFVMKLDLNGDFVWANSYGSTANDIGWDVTSDDNDNIYVTGQFRNDFEFETGNASSEVVSEGGNDMFILKLTPAGVFDWSKSFGSVGGNGFEAGSKIDLDSDGNIFVSGFYEGTVDFDAGVGVSSVTSTGDRDACLLKLDSNGDFEWVKSIGSNVGDDKGKGVAFDLDNNIYHIGLFTGTVAVAGSDLVSNGLTDCFIQKMDQSGNELWGASYGGTEDDFLNGILIDADAGIYFNGKFSSETDVDPSANDSLVSPFGDIDGYMFKWKLQDVLVASITVQGESGVGEITIQNGMLQMEASVMPVNATDGTYVWSVANGTGSATIDVNGLLTAVSDGVVTVTATANDASGVTGSTDIMISNQTLNISSSNIALVNVYPSPVSDKLFIENIKNVNSIQLYSISGQFINEFMITSNETIHELNTEELIQGVYFLLIENKAYKFVKN